MDAGARADIAVVAPSPMLAITVEPDGDIHVHAGGQGFWVARQAARLSTRETLCARGVAAGAMNVTRGGLGTGRAEHIDVLPDQRGVRAADDHAGHR